MVSFKGYWADQTTRTVFRLSLWPLTAGALLFLTAFSYNALTNERDLPEDLARLALVIVGCGLFLNIFWGVAFASRTQPPGFQRLSLVAVSIAAAVSLYTNHNFRYGLWNRYDNFRQNFERFFEGLFWSATTTAAVAIALVASIAIGLWIADGFRTGQRK